MASLAVVNPYDQQVIGAVELISWQTVDQWLEVACRLSRDRAQWLSAPILSMFSLRPMPQARSGAVALLTGLG